MSSALSTTSPKISTSPETEIAILVYDGFDELDGVGPYEVFANAADAGADCSVSLRTVNPVETVTPSHALTIQPDSVTSGLDLAIHLVDREFGADVADAVRTEMEYEPRGEIHR